MKFSRPDYRPLQRFYLAGLEGESCPPRTSLGAQSGRSWAGDSALPSPAPTPGGTSSFTYWHSEPRQLHSQILDLRPWAEIFCRCLCWDLLEGEGKANLEKTPLGLWTQYFSTPSLSPLRSPQSRVHKTARAFYLGLPQQWDTTITAPMSVLMHLTLHLWEEKGTGGVGAFSVVDSCSYHHSFKGLTSFWLVALINYSETWQLSSLFPSSAEPRTIIMHKIHSFTS